MLQETPDSGNLANFSTLYWNTCNNTKPTEYVITNSNNYAHPNYDS